MNPITSTIKGAAVRDGYNGVSLSKAIGMPYQTLNYRYRHPETWKLYEIASLFRHVEFTESDMDIIRKEVRKL